MSLFEELKRRRVFRLAVAYLVVAWLIVQVIDVIKDPLNLPEWFHTVVIVFLGLMFPIALMLSWAYDVTPDGLVRDDGAPTGSTRIDYGKIALAAVLVLGAFLAGSYLRQDGLTRSAAVLEPVQPHVQQIRFDVTSTLDIDVNRRRPIALTPDGQTIVAFAAIDEQTFLMSREMRQFDFVKIDGTDNADRPFAISPDGKSVVFHDIVDDYLKKVPISGGPPISLTQVDGTLHTIDWGTNGFILYGTTSDTGLSRISQDGGGVTAITNSATDYHYHHARFIPGSDALIVSIGRPGLTHNTDDQLAVLMPTGELLESGVGGASPVVTPDGVVVYFHNGTLWATLLDTSAGTLARNPIVIAENVSYAAFAIYSLSHEGSLIHGIGPRGVDNILVRVDREGNETVLPFAAGNDLDPSISPDGERIALIQGSRYGADVWIHSIDGIEGEQISFFEGLERAPTWSPDGRYLYFSATRPDNIYRYDTELKSELEKITDTPTAQFMNAVSPDGRFLFISEQIGMGVNSQSDIALVELLPTPVYQPLINSQYSEWSPAISPDGNWLAYTSDQSGKQEVYLRRFPIDDSRITQVSRFNGRNRQAVWSPDGTELYYLGDSHVMAVPITTESDLIVGEPVPLFNHERYRFTMGQYISPTGDFLFIRTPFDHSAISDQIVLVRDWRNLLNDASATP